MGAAGKEYEFRLLDEPWNVIRIKYLFLKKPWCHVDGELKHWNLLSNKLIRLKFSPERDNRDEVDLSSVSPFVETSTSWLACVPSNDTLGKLLSTREAIFSCDSYASLVFSNLRAASLLSRRMHANRELIVKK